MVWPLICDCVAHISRVLPEMLAAIDDRAVLVEIFVKHRTNVARVVTLFIVHTMPGVPRQRFPPHLPNGVECIQEVVTFDLSRRNLHKLRSGSWMLCHHGIPYPFRRTLR